MAEIAGLKLIVPSSVAGSGVSVSASGKVTFTAATSVSVNGVFSSAYDNYLTVLRIRASSSGELVYCRLRSSGSDASGTDYGHQYLAAGNTSIGAARYTSQTNFRIIFCSANMSGAHTWFYGPNLAQATVARVNQGSDASGNNIYDTAANHSLASAYDGFTFFVVSNNISGSMTVYGLAQ